MKDDTNLDPGIQVPFDYTERQIEWLTHCLSPERLAPYYDKARGNDWVAFHLYVRNVELSAALYGVIHALEVGLRNVVHRKMVAACKAKEWWDRVPLHDDELNDIAEAKKNIQSRLKETSPDRIVAELSLGFWVKMFANSYEKQLWVPHLSRCFPAKLPRKTLHDRLSRQKELRNRIAHHETLIRRNVAQDYGELLESIGWISPILRSWVEHHTDFPSIYARRIPKQPKPVQPSASDSPAGR